MARRSFFLGTLGVALSLLITSGISVALYRGGFIASTPPSPFGGGSSTLKGALQNIGGDSRKRIVNVTFSQSEAFETLSKDTLYFVRMPSGSFPRQGQPLAAILPPRYKYYGYKYFSPAATRERDGVARSQAGEPLSYSEMFPGEFFTSWNSPFVTSFSGQHSLSFLQSAMVTLESGALYVIVVEEDAPVRISMRYENSVCHNGILESPAELCDDIPLETSVWCSDQCTIPHPMPSAIITQESLGSGIIEAVKGQVIPVMRFTVEARERIGFYYFVFEILGNEPFPSMEMWIDMDSDGILERNVGSFPTGQWTQIYLADHHDLYIEAGRTVRVEFRALVEPSVEAGRTFQIGFFPFPAPFSPRQALELYADYGTETRPLTSLRRDGGLCRHERYVYASSSCEIELTTVPSPIWQVVEPASCGDGQFQPDGADQIPGNADDEQCDDGNTIPGDGCTTCSIDAGYVCDTSAEPSQCTPVEQQVSGCVQDSDCGNLSLIGCYSGQCLYWCDEPPQEVYPACPSGACTAFGASSSACTQ